MKNLKESINYLFDLKRQHEIISRRYYNRDSESIILKLINKELIEIPKELKLPQDIYLSLSKIDRTSSMSILKLCEIYRELILIKERDTSK